MIIASSPIRIFAVCLEILTPIDLPLQNFCSKKSIKKICYVLFIETVQTSFEKHMIYYHIFMDCPNQIKIKETQWQWRSMSLTFFKSYVKCT